MPGRFGRRNGASLFKILMGLALAGALRRAFTRRARPGRGAPLILVLMLLGAFMGFGVLLALLGGVVSLLGGAGAAGLICLAPAAVILLVVWAIVQGQSRGQKLAGAETIDAATPARETTQTAAAAPAPQAREAQRAPAATMVPRQTAPRQAVPRPIDAYPERGARSPAEYRKRATSYRQRIQNLIKKRRRGPLAERLADVVARLSSWEERVGQLADRVTLFENDDLIRRDIKEVPNHIARLRRQIPLEADPAMQRQMARTLAAYEQQHSHLEALARLIRRTRLNLEDTLAAMGTIYSQVQVLNAMDIDGSAAARIADEIDVEVNRLNDLLSALSEVNSGDQESQPASQSDGEGDGEAGLAGRRSRLERGGIAG